MAENENTNKTIKSINPKASHILKTFDKKLKEKGLQIPGVTLTETMTEEEKEMVFAEMFLRHGYSEEKATRLAKEEYKQYKELWS